MKTVGTVTLLNVVNSISEGEAPFEALRELVFSFYEAEEGITLDEQMESLFAVLAPYLEYEEVYGDPNKRSKILRLKRMIENGRIQAEHAVFAIEFDMIKSISQKLKEGVITREVFEKKVKELSPANIDWNKVFLWAYAHTDIPELDLSLISCEGEVGDRC